MPRRTIAARPARRSAVAPVRPLRESEHSRTKRDDHGSGAGTTAREGTIRRLLEAKAFRTTAELARLLGAAPAVFRGGLCAMLYVERHDADPDAGGASKSRGGRRACR
jgi:hypothetical protein